MQLIICACVCVCVWDQRLLFWETCHIRYVKRGQWMQNVWFSRVPTQLTSVIAFRSFAKTKRTILLNDVVFSSSSSSGTQSFPEKLH